MVTNEGIWKINPGQTKSNITEEDIFREVIIGYCPCSDNQKLSHSLG